MYGVKCHRGWLQTVSGPKGFFTFSGTPVYPFRSVAGAAQVAYDWLDREEFDVFSADSTEAKFQVRNVLPKAR